MRVVGNRTEKDQLRGSNDRDEWYGTYFPGACVPHGLVQLSPDTDTVPHNVNGTYQPRAYEYCAGYQHRDSSIVGFSHTHFNGTGHSDLGDILIMPITGDVKFNPGTAKRIRIVVIVLVSLMTRKKRLRDTILSCWKIMM